MDPQAAFADAVARARQVFTDWNNSFPQNYTLSIHHASLHVNFLVWNTPRGQRKKARGFNLRISKNILKQRG